MPPYEEAQLRKIVDGPTIKIIEKWHSLSNSVIGKPLPVIAGNRRNIPDVGGAQNQAFTEAMRSAKGEVNTAFPVGYRGKVVLSVWLDSFPAIKPVLLTHEIGHWVLKLEGFQGLIHKPRDRLAELYFNDVASHPPLYALQKSAGHDPQPLIDARCAYNVKKCSQPGKEDELLSALNLADDRLNCSWKLREKLEWTLSKYQPKVMKIVSKIVKVSSEFDLYSSTSNVAFREKLAKKLNMSKWTKNDEIRAIKKQIVEIEGNT